MAGADWIRLGVSGEAMPIIVSFYTSGFYKREAFELARTMQPFALDYHIQKVESLGSWAANTNWKPSFLLSMSKLYPGRSLLWLDADARVRKMPHLLSGLRAQVAYAIFRGQIGRHGPLSGTVFLKRDEEGDHSCRNRLLSEWITDCDRSPALTDQICLHQAVKRLGVSYSELPASYCWIYDFAQGTWDPSPEHEKAVIEHMQASRFARKEQEFV